MADGNSDTGRKELREQVSQSAEPERVQEGRERPVRRSSPAPTLRSPEMNAARPTRLLPPNAEMDAGIRRYERRSFYADLRARARGEPRDGASLLRHDFDRERD